MNRFQAREGETPGQMVARLRHRRQLTLKELGKLADTPFSYIWAIEKQKRYMGTSVAFRIATALRMSAKDVDAFVLWIQEHKTTRNNYGYFSKRAKKKAAP